MTLVPPRNAPMVSVIHCVVCVSELAVCSSSLFAMVGRMADRPLVKNGEANISSALSRYSSQVSVRGIARMNPSATTARIRSLAIMMRLRSNRSSTTPATGPASTAGIARDSMTPVTTNPERVFASARLKTATLLK